MKNIILWAAIEKQIISKKPICLFDFSDREGETDVVYIGQTLTAKDVDFLRRDVGSPLSIYVSGQFLRNLGIFPFSEFIKEKVSNGPLRKLVESNRGHDPRFAISIDARDNFTGCSPIETAHTINSLFNLVSRADETSDDKLADTFVENFIAPGHVPVIPSAENLLKERKGHVELSITIAKIFNLPEIVVAGELIDPYSLKSMDQKTAQEFARKHNFPFLTGKDVLNKINV